MNNLERLSKSIGKRPENDATMFDDLDYYSSLTEWLEKALLHETKRAEGFKEMVEYQIFRCNVTGEEEKEKALLERLESIDKGES